MKTLFRAISLFVVLIAATAFAGVPPMNVTVSNSGKAAFKGKTDAKGTFATGKLAPGNYVVQFNSSDSSVKGKQFALVVSAGTKKVSADVVAGEKFLGGGVAMKIEVGTGLNVTGQVAAAANARIDPSTKKKMVWLPPRVGSNMPGRWVPADSPEAIAAQNSGELRREDVSKMQDHGDGAGLGR